MVFDYNDKLVIRDRQQMEDLFKYRLEQFDSDRTKKIDIINNTSMIMLVLGKFNRDKNTLTINLYDATHMTDIPESDINIVIRYGNIGTIQLLNKINFNDY